MNGQSVISASSPPRMYPDLKAKATKNKTGYNVVINDILIHHFEDEMYWRIHGGGARYGLPPPGLISFIFMQFAADAGSATEIINLN